MTKPKLKNNGLRILSSINKVLDYLVKDIPLKKFERRIDAIKQILLNKKSMSSFNEHFKFDISFGLDSPSFTDLRFTYNDYKEEEGLRNKIIKIFGLFKSAFNIDTLKEILSLSGNPLTFGIDWERGREIPRLKVYFEAVGGNESRLLNNICRKINISPDRFTPYLNSSWKMCAIGIDFLGAKSYNLKIYTYANNDKYPDFFKQSQIRQIEGFREYLSLEGQGFFLNCFGLCNYSRSESLKHYKIYSTREFQETGNLKEIFLKRYKEIGLLPIRADLKDNFKKRIERLGRITAEYSAVVYPIALSINLQPKQRRPSKFGIYLSFKTV